MITPYPTSPGGASYGHYYETHAPAPPIPTERLRCFLLWLTGVSGAIVFIEPSPYEVMTLLTMVLFFVVGISVPRSILPLGVLLILINIGYTISASGFLGAKGVDMWLATSWYLAITALFFATVLSSNTEARLDALLRGCLIGGIIASLVAILGYFCVIPGADDLLIFNSRARGTFKDPNVLGAFLVLPGLIALQRIITGKVVQAIWSAILLGLIVVAILLSFSRGAWAQIVYTALVLLGLTFLTSRSPAQRLRIVLLSVAGAACITMLIAALLSMDIVAKLFEERASLNQSYDVGAQGRFARHSMGAILALDKPFGIGPLQFNTYFTEDPHNSFLNAFMAGGWLSGACYPAVVILTLVFGLRAVFTPSPWQQATIVVYVGYFGVATESLIIDTDHWRHAFLLLGLLWGIIAATRADAHRRMSEHAAPALAPSRTPA